MAITTSFKSISTTATGEEEEENPCQPLGLVGGFGESSDWCFHAQNYKCIAPKAAFENTDMLGSWNHACVGNKLPQNTPVNLDLSSLVIIAYCPVTSKRND